MNETLESGKRELFVNENDLRDFLWKVKSKNDRIIGFKKGIVEKTIPIIVQCQSEEGVAVKNKIFEVFEKDVLAMEPGKIFINDYYLKCFVTESAKTDYLISKNHLKITVKISTDHALWCKEKHYSFKVSEKQIVDTEKKEEIMDMLDGVDQAPDYPLDYKRKYITKYKSAKKRYIRDYKYDFYSNHTIRKIDNDHFAETAFKMIVYGPCTHPFIQIGENIYEVHAGLYEGEYLVIDSRERTVIKYTRYGVAENVFNARSKEYNVFKKIATGKQNVKWNATYAFDLILYQERSEPPWK